MSSEQHGKEPDLQSKDTKPLLFFVMTSPYCLNAFLLGHLHRISREFRILVCVNMEESEFPIRPSDDFEVVNIAMRREIAPWHDLLALFSLVRIFRSQPAKAVISFTPKAGLLGMVAARLANVPVRIHYFTGQVWATAKGVKRLMLKTLDQVLAKCATTLLADSQSQKKFLVSQNISESGKLHVLGSGSVSGVDLVKFTYDADVRREIRLALSIPADAICLLFIGRMKRDKGVEDLLSAFSLLLESHPSVHLLLVGPDEEGLLKNVTEVNIHPIGYTSAVEKYMAASDILCLPSYREGFGNVLIEAAAIGLPSVASRIYGITDAVVEGETGLLHEPGDIQAIKECLSELLSSPGKCRELGLRGRERVLCEFSANRIKELFFSLIKNCIEKSEAHN